MVTPRPASRPGTTARHAGRSGRHATLADLRITSDALAWQRHGHCHSTDPDAFFPDVESLRQHPEIRRICTACPVRTECADYATRHHLVGIWGATTTHQRQLHRRRTHQHREEAA